MTQKLNFNEIFVGISMPRKVGETKFTSVVVPTDDDPAEAMIFRQPASARDQSIRTWSADWCGHWTAWRVRRGYFDSSTISTDYASSSQRPAT